MIGKDKNFRKVRNKHRWTIADIFWSFKLNLVRQGLMSMEELIVSTLAAMGGGGKCENAKREAFLGIRYHVSDGSPPLMTEMPYSSLALPVFLQTVELNPKKCRRRQAGMSKMLMMLLAGWLFISMPSCKKDPCKDVSCPQGTVATESADGKKCSCVPIVVNVETEIVKVGTIAEIQALEQKISSLKSENEHLKNVVIEFAKSIETADNQKVVLQEFGKLKTKLKSLGLVITLDQGDEWVYPRDHGQILKFQEYLQMNGEWGENINLGANMRNLAFWNPDTLQLFLNLGLSPDIFQKPDPIDTLNIAIASVQDFSNNRSNIINRSNQKNSYTLVYLTGNMVENNLANQYLRELMTGNVAGLGSVSPVEFDHKGFKVVPQSQNSGTSFNLTPALYSGVDGKVGKNPVGITWWADCTEKDALKNLGMDTLSGKVATYNEHNCTHYIHDTLFVVNGKDMAGYSAWYAASFAKPNSTQYVQFKGNNRGNIDLTNSPANWIELDKILKDVNAGKLVFVPGNGTFAPVDSVNTNGKAAILNAASQKGLVKTMSVYATKNYWYNDGTDQNLMPTAYRTGTADISTINFNKTLAKKINLNAEFNVDVNLPPEYINGTLPITVQFVLTPAPGQLGGVNPFVGVTNGFLWSISTKTVPDATLPMEIVDMSGNLSDPVLAVYSNNAKTTDPSRGLKITALDVNGGGRGWEKMAKSGEKVGGNLYPMWSTSKPIIPMVFHNVNPNNLMDGKMIFELDSVQKEMEKVRGPKASNIASFTIPNAVFYSQDVNDYTDYFMCVVKGGRPRKLISMELA